MKRLVANRELLMVGAIVLVAVFFRAYRLSEIPGGMTGDEAVRGLEASSIVRAESYPIFFEVNAGEEPMHAYLVAIMFHLLGTGVLSIRTASALVGIITVPLFYLLVKEFFPPTKDDSWSAVAVLATAWLATSYWHTVYSRYGLEPILVPLFAVLTIYFLWRGLNSRQRLYFIGAGIFLGLSLYTYQAARFLPLLALLLLACYFWVNRGSLRSQWVNGLILLIAFVVATAPLGIYAMNRPDIFFARARRVSIFNPELNQGSPVQAFGMALTKTAAMYPFLPDLNREHNPAIRPILDPLTSICLALGLAICLYRRRQTAYLFLLVWSAIMSLPAAVTIDSLPHFSRAIGALPAVYVFPAIGVIEARKWLQARLRSGLLGATLGSVLISVPLVFASVTTYVDYFLVWETSEDLRQGYDGAYTAAATMMNETHVADSVWILPLTALAQSGYGSDHFDFLYHGDSPYYTVRVDETTGANELSAICQERRRALVVSWKGYVLEEAYNALSADPKGLISFFLQKYGSELDRKSYEAFDVVTYQLPESPAFSIAEGLEPLTVNLGHQLMLTGMAFGGSSLQDTSTPLEADRRELPSGRSGWVVLRWQALTVPSGNYKVAVYLQDQGGHVAGQTDKLLLSNYLHPTQDWEAGQEEIDYYTLPSWGGTAPGRYEVGVTLYDAETLQVVPLVGGGKSHALGMMEIVRPLVAAEVEPEVAIEEDTGELAPGIRLLGYDLPRKDPNPGDELSVALYWQALKDVNRDYLIAVQLTDDKGEVWAESFDSPVYGTYPTGQWAEGEVLKDWHHLSLPTDMPQGDYEAFVRILEGEDSLGEAALGQFEVHGRARVFRIPPIQHPMEATLGEGVLFLGYDLGSNEVTPGGALRLTLYWQALEDMQISYTVFTHLLDEEERIWGQMDSIPQRGEAPTTSWLAGEIITDQYEIAVAQEAPSGTYVLEIGMYDGTTGQRLRVLDAQGQPRDDRVLLQTIRVLSAGGE